MSSYWENYWKRKISRRRILGAGAAGVAGSTGLLLVGCGDDDDDDSNGNGGGTTGGDERITPVGSTPSSEQPRQGGILRPMTIVSQNLDPHRTTATISFGRIYNNLMRFSIKEPGLTEGGLAEDSPEIAPDGVTVTFKIRPEAKWQNKAPVNGRAVTAEDVKLSYERIMDPNIVSPRAGLLANVESIEAIDDSTVQFKLKSPQADLFAIMSDLFMDVLPKEITSRGLDAIQSVDDVIGSGPYEMVSFAAAEKYSLRRRSDGYWRPNTAWLDGYDYTHQTDGQQLANALRAGQADGAGLPVDLAKTFEGDPDFQITRAPSPIKECLAINHGRERYQDPRVRLALQRAINRAQVYETVYGGGGMPSGPMTPAGPFWALPEEELAKLPGFGDRDTEIREAKALLEAAGHPDGFEETVLSITAFNLEKVHEVVVSNLRDVGITVRTENVGTDVAAHMLPRLVQGDFNLATFGFASGAYPDAQLVLYHHSDRTKGSRNYWGYSSPELDQMLDEQAQIYDADERRKLVHDIQRYIINNPGPVWMGVRLDFGVWSSRVKNVGAFGFYAEYYDAENVWLEA